MRAVRFHHHGGPEVLRCEDVNDVEAGPGHVVVAVSAAGVNFADTLLRSGSVGAGTLPLPMTPGFEVAGTITAVGAGVDPNRIGQRVAATTPGSGGYADYALAADTATHAIPDNLDEHTAAAVLGQGASALGIIDTAHLTSNDTVLIPAAAGGVGSLMVQLAKHTGATVIATVGGPAKIDVATQVGADTVIDYTNDDWPHEVRDAAGGQLQVIIDTIGGPFTATALPLLAPITGRLVICGASAGPATVDTARIMRANITVIGYASATRRDDRHQQRRIQALALAAQGRLQPVIGTILPLEQAAVAHQMFADRTNIGKTILAP